MYRADTIVARATAPGRSAVAIVRLSGAGAFPIASLVLKPRHARQSMRPWQLVRCDAIDPADQVVIDDVLAVRMPGPNSYTGEDVVEIHCHGSPVVVERLMGVALAAGARDAEPGEFTRRAVLNRRMDLLQAEAIVDLIDAPVLSGVKAACRQLDGAVSKRVSGIRDAVMAILADVEAHIDFSDDDLSDEDAPARLAAIARVVDDLDALLSGFQAARRERDGYRVVFYGRPNVGKSSLFNALVGFGRAIVANESGTTRDTLEETIDLEGWALVLTDTAGMRDASSVSEAAAVERSRTVAASADIAVCVLDGSLPLTDVDHRLLLDPPSSGALLCVLNKSDLGDGMRSCDRELLTSVGVPTVRVSALDGSAAATLQTLLIDAAKRVRGSDTTPPAGLSRERHRAAAERTRIALGRTLNAMASSERTELAAIELRDALDELATITEPLDNEQVLDRIFAEFCVGK